MNQDNARGHLMQDNLLAQIIVKYQVDPRVESTNLFYDLLDAIISQQLSNKAAATIFSRFLQIFPKGEAPQPADILPLSEETLRSCGLSRQKVTYIRSLAFEIASHKLDLEGLRLQSDDEVIDSLTQVKGIGPWTAEMFLIFSLARPDVFSLGDLGLRNAISKIYHVDREDKIAIEKISQSWAPFRSLASLYLWKSLEN